MRFIIDSAVKDLRRLRRDPISLAVWIGIPVVIAVLLTTIFGRGAAATVPHGVLLIADEDESMVSAVLADSFDRGALAKMITVNRVDRAEGNRRMNAGEASALLIIPKGLGQAYLRSQPFDLQLIRNPSQQILPGIIEETLSMMTDFGFYLQLSAGPYLKAISGDRTAPERDMGATLVALHRAIGKLAAIGEHPPIALKMQVIEQKTTAARAQNFGALLFPGLLFLSLLFIGMGLSSDIWKERLNGTLRRLAATPARVEACMMGKLIAAIVVVLLVGAAGLLAGRWLSGIPLDHAAPALAWLVCCGAAFFLLMLHVQLFASNQRAANLLGNLMVFPLMMLGGSFFPLDAMPERLAAIGRWTPNGWALAQFQAIMSGAMQPERMAVNFVAVLAACAIALVFAARRMRGWA